MKRILIMAVAIAVSGLFSACKKDAVKSITGSKENQLMFASHGGTEHAERLFLGYENYTMPAESVLSEKLSLIDRCMSNPDENILPDMELKEAVWFLETYFNAGVCQKQEYSVEVDKYQETFLITVPLVAGTGTNMFLSGKDLKWEYRNMVKTIVHNVFPEYAVNIGDVYVHALNGASVTLGLEIFYGHKVQKDGDGEPCPVFLRKIATDLNINPVVYPTWRFFPQNDFPYQYGTVRKLLGQTIDDIGMNVVLNQTIISLVPGGIIHPPEEVAWRDPIINTHGNGSYSIHPTLDTWLTFDRNFYDDRTNGSNFDKSYGEIYRDDIWNYLLPSCPPMCAVPFKAGCKLVITSNGNRANVYHTWGIVTTYNCCMVPCNLPSLSWNGMQ